MELLTLMENTALSPAFVCHHGLSFYLEWKNRKILFDMGPDGDFIKNAKALGVDLKAVDLAVLSHGHYDHGGGLKAFLEENEKASVHIQKKAEENYYAHDPDGKIRYIGLPDGIKGCARFVSHKGDYTLEEGLSVFSGVTGRACYSPSNDRLYTEIHGRQIPDLFMHEQNLLLEEDGYFSLIAGCAHNGIVNILKRGQELTKGRIRYVIGGFHLKNAFDDVDKQREFCRKLAETLKEWNCQYYTCHCTGEESYEYLKEFMGEQIQYLAAGSRLVTR